MKLENFSNKWGFAPNPKGLTLKGFRKENQLKRSMGSSFRLTITRALRSLLSVTLSSQVMPSLYHMLFFILMTYFPHFKKRELSNLFLENN